MKQHILFLLIFSKPIVIFGSFPFGTNYVPLRNLSKQCTIDVEKWFSSFVKFQNSSGYCDPHDKECPGTKDTIFSVKQLDSFGRFDSTGILELRSINDGSYLECDRISGEVYETNYCYLKLVRKDLPANESTKFMNLRHAVCVPKTCTKLDITNIFNQAMPDSEWKAENTFCSTVDVEKSFAFYAFSAFMVLIIILVVISSIVDYIFLKYEVNVDRFDLKCFLSFSIYTNASKIFAYKENTESNFIACLEFLRCFSLFWIIHGHTSNHMSFSETTAVFTDILHSMTNRVFFIGFLSVETFFLLSGIVVSFSFFKYNIDREKIKSPITWLTFYLHRYFRLTPSYMIFIGFYTVYGVFIQGPYDASQFNSFATTCKACETKWWQNLLYIDNFDSNRDTTCFGIGWYLASDTQLYLVTPIFLIAFHYSTLLGSIFTLVACFGSILTTYIIFGVYDLPADTFVDFPNKDYNDLLFRPPWIRGAPYIFGIMIGYFLATCKQGKVKLKWYVNVFFWILSLGTLFLCVTVNYDYDLGTTNWNWFQKATFNNFSRLCWSMAIGWIIVANHMGWGGPVNSFMSHKFWQPFGRLSYSTYIVHMMVMYYYMNLGSRPIQYFSIWQLMCHYTVPVVVMCFTAAFIWSCLFELPSLRLEKLVLQKILGIERMKEEIHVSKSSRIYPVQNMSMSKV